MNREKWTTEFVKLVASLREEQKKFFATKQSVHLYNAKQLELQVDDKVKQFLNIGLPFSEANTQHKLEL